MENSIEEDIIKIEGLKYFLNSFALDTVSYVIFTVYIKAAPI